MNQINLSIVDTYLLLVSFCETNNCESFVDTNTTHDYIRDYSSLGTYLFITATVSVKLLRQKRISLQSSYLERTIQSP